MWLLFVLTTCKEIVARNGKQDFNEPVWTFELREPPLNNKTGDSLATELRVLDLKQREAAIYTAIEAGNIPLFLRTPVQVQFSETLEGKLYNVSFYVAPDYLSLGSDDNHLLMPMTPMLAQKVMDLMGGILPTRKMVDLIWQVAPVKLPPEPIPPSAAMVTVPVFDQHNRMVRTARNALLSQHPLGELVSGHKKDVILSNRILGNADKVVIYGWHDTNGVPIQPLYSGHANYYADYSHGIRPVVSRCEVNGNSLEISEVLSDSVLFRLLSDEPQPMYPVRYDTSSTNYP